MPRLICTCRSEPAMVTPSSPTKSASSALACRLVKWRAGASRSVASSRPKSAWPSRRPSASSLPPCRPAKADRPAPPSVSVSAWMTLPSDRVRSWRLLCSAKSPSTAKKSKTLSSMWAAASSSSPALPAKSSVRVLPGPVATGSGCAAQSTTTPSASARLMRSSTWLTVATSPSTPMKAALPALASSALQWRAVPPAACSCSVASTRPKPTSSKRRPMASLLPPARPAKPRAWAAPTVSRSTSTWVWSSSARVTVPLLRLKAKSPSSCTKPKRSRVRWPAARVTAPSLPSRARVNSVSAPVSTARPWLPEKSSTTPSAAARLMATDRSCPLALKPSSPVKPAVPALACSTLHWRAGALWPVAVFSVARASARSTPDRPKPVSPTPAKASRSCAPSVSRRTCTSPDSSAAVPARSAVCKVVS